MSLWTYPLSKSESVKFSLIETVIWFFTDSPAKKIYFLKKFSVKKVNQSIFVSENIFFTVKSVNFHWSNHWNLTDLQLPILSYLN